MASPRTPFFAPWLENPRALPFKPAPVPAETTLSYLCRLGQDNALPLSAVLSQIGLGPAADPPPGADLALTPSAWSRLGVMVGRSPAALSRAITPAPLPARLIARDQPRLAIVTTYSHQITDPCRRCLLERGIYGGQYVEIRLNAVTYLCPRHNRWLRDNQFDISGLPELARAQHRHNRLAARHQLEHLAAAQSAARDIVEGWSRFPFHPLAVRFRDRQSRAVAQNPGILMPHGAAGYPELVHLTAMIASPQWNTAARGNRHEHERFLREANHRLHTDDLHHADPNDPLLAWLRIQASHRGRFSADPRSSSPLLSSPPLRLPGWAQPTPTTRPRSRLQMSRPYMAALHARTTDTPRSGA